MVVVVVVVVAIRESDVNEDESGRAKDPECRGLEFRGSSIRDRSIAGDAQSN